MPNLFRRNTANSQPCHHQQTSSTALSRWDKFKIFFTLFSLFSIVACIKIGELLDAPRNVPILDTVSADRLVPYFADDTPQYHTDAAIQVRKLPTADVLRVVLANVQADNNKDPQSEMKMHTALRCLSAADLNVSRELAQLLTERLLAYAATKPTPLTDGGLLMAAVQNLQKNRLLDADQMRRLFSLADFRAKHAMIETELSLLKAVKKTAIGQTNAVSTSDLDELTGILLADILITEQRIRSAGRVSSAQMELLRDLEIQGKTLETAAMIPGVADAFLGEVKSCADAVLLFLNPPKTSGTKTFAISSLPLLQTTGGVIALGGPPKPGIIDKREPFKRQKNVCITTWGRLRKSLETKFALP